MFACLLKPIQNDSEFIILNKKGVVLSKTKAISQEITSATKSKLFSEEAGGVVTIKSIFDKGDEVLGAIQTQFLHETKHNFTKHELEFHKKLVTEGKIISFSAYHSKYSVKGHYLALLSKIPGTVEDFYRL
jgi:hypothetical protein